MHERVSTYSNARSRTPSANSSRKWPTIGDRWEGHSSRSTSFVFLPLQFNILKSNQSIVGCSAYSVHYDESVWGTDARQFKPERWLMGNAKQLDNYLVSFSKGSRQCIGMKYVFSVISRATY